jgi:gamma-glutamyltranspeptidase/glutathione hydrolase
MVSTAHHASTEAGRDILESGGNAVDAAVAAAFALGVCEPQASGLGGQTMMMIHKSEDRRTFALDGSSRAPNRVSLATADRRARSTGYRATTVPSTPSTLAYALEHYGTLPLKQVLEPAIRLADQGFVVTPLLEALTRREAKRLRAGTAGQFFLNNGRRYRAGTVLRQPVLAQTLRRLAKHGVKDFYTGEIASLIDEDMVAHDGLLRRDDLAQMPRPIERPPLTCRFEGSRVLTCPLPGAGRTLVMMLNAFPNLPARLRRIDSPQGALALAALIRWAFTDRRDRPFDPNYYMQTSDKRMLSTDYARDIARQIAKRIPSSGDTTHLSVMDRDNNAVALTQSIEKVYGSCSASAGLGFLYNNYLSAYEYENPAHPYFLRPNAVPWASVAPTIAFRGRTPWLVIGSPGSERITSSIFQVLIRLANGYAPMAAVEAPRLHCSLEGKVSLEAERMPEAVTSALESAGYAVDAREAYAFYLGCVQLVIRDAGEFVGVADPRRDGSAAGPRA